MKALSLSFCIASAAALSGCGGVFLQPDRVLHARPERFGAVWEEARFSAADGTKLTGLWFPARAASPKGTVVQFHGNGENMSSHFLYVYWLQLEGWNVLAFDYRGYGASDGSKSLSGAVLDGAAALAHARARAPGLPLVVLGQSLGGNLALASLSRDGGKDVRALVLDSTFESFRAIAREKLAVPLVTRWLRWPLSFLVPDSYSADRLIARFPDLPLLMLHGKEDPVVSYERGRRLFALAPQPKEFWDVPGRGHLSALGERGAEFRPRLAEYLAKFAAR